MIRVGQIGGAYGLDGAVKVIPLTDFADRFDAGATFLGEGAEREEERSSPGDTGQGGKRGGVDNSKVDDRGRGRNKEGRGGEGGRQEEGRSAEKKGGGVGGRAGATGAGTRGTGGAPQSPAATRQTGHGASWRWGSKRN